MLEKINLFLKTAKPYVKRFFILLIDGIGEVIGKALEVMAEFILAFLYSFRAKREIYYYERKFWIEVFWSLYIYKEYRYYYSEEKIREVAAVIFWVVVLSFVFFFLFLPNLPAILNWIGDKGADLLGYIWTNSQETSDELINDLLEMQRRVQ